MNNCPELISLAAARFPHKTALLCERRSLTFAKLEKESSLLARTLSKLGLEKNAILPILLPRGCDVAVTLLAIWKAGLAGCVLDMSYPEERNLAIRRQCGTEYILDESVLARLREGNAESGAEPLPSPSPDDPALAVFTSGSTGQPKGVLLPHRALDLAARGTMRLLHEDDVMLSTASQSFIAIMLDLFAPLAAGLTVHIAPESIRKDVGMLAEYIRKEGIGVSFLSPQMAAPFLDMADGALRCLLTGSERVRNIWSNRTAIINTYGASETCGPLFYFPLDQAYANTPIGKAYPGSRLFLLDETGKPAAPGEIGEICVQGQIALGYLHQPELTAQRFGSAPEITGNDDPLFRTGDLGRMLPDGSLEYVQRKDWMLKIRGFRVEPGEIEAVMLASAPLDKAVVTGFEDSSGQTRLYACYTASRPVDEDSLRRAMAQKLPEYMLPAFMEQVDSLPLNPNGKIDRSRILPPDASSLQADYAPPQTALEKEICQAFAKTLGQKNIGLDDDFLLLGGDSISAMRIQAMLAGKGLKAAMLLARRTPRALAQDLENGSQIPDPLRLAPDMEYWPPTFAESQMAAEQSLEPTSVAYNINLGFAVDGPLDIPRLRRALAAMARSHRILRSFYPMREGVHVHCLAPTMDEVPLDIETCPETDVPGRVASRNVPFDLSRPPLFRCVLFNVSPRRHILHFTFHHIIMDGLSVAPLLDSLWQAYIQDLPLQGAAPARPDYLDFAVRQAGEPEADFGFFINMFADGVPENEMPTRPIRSDQLPCPDAKASRRIPFDGIGRTARGLGVTTHALLMSALGITLAKYCGNDDVVVGTAMNCRDLPETVDMVGMFVNTLPLRLKPEGGASLRDYISATAKLLEEARSHSSCPFSSLVPLLAPDRNASRAPIFDVLLNYLEDPPLSDTSSANLALAPFPLPTQALPMDLTLELRRREGDLHMDLLYSTLLYHPEIAEAMLDHFCLVLERIGSGKDMTLADAGELGPAQCRQILEDFAGKDTGPASGQTVVDAFREMARQYPERRAVAINDAPLNYSELDAVTDNLAIKLAAMGLGRGKVVGILVGRGPMMPVGALGALKSGAAYLPLDPSYPAERLEYMLADSKAELLIADEELLDKLPSWRGPVLLSWDIMAVDNILTEAPGNALPPAPAPDDLLTLIYTSGTTGKPKGVMISHGNLDNFCQWYASHYRLEPDDLVAAYASFGFDACLMDMFPALTHGAGVQIIPEDMRLDLPALNETFEKYGVTLAFMTTQLGRQFAAAMPNKSLRVLAVGGETLAPMQPPAGYALENVYGPTECTIFTSAFRMDKRHDRVPLGYPLDNMRAYILDKNGRLAPVGVPGELCVAGRQVASGYLNRPDLTAEKFTPNPFSNAPGYERIYHTGDIMRWLPDGSLDFIGRRDFQVKIRGFRVELSEIEGRIRQYPHARDAAVVALDAPGGGKCAVAYVVPDKDSHLDVDKLNAFIAEKLPPYMIPAATVLLDAIPLNPNGKVDRKKLPAPDYAATARQDNGSSQPDQPESLFSKTIRDVVAQVLGHGQFGRNSNLLRAGLASLSAIRLATLLAERLGHSPAVREIMADPTLLGLENAITRAMLHSLAEGAALETTNAPQSSAARPAAWPLAPNQLGIYFDCEKRPESMAYNIPFRLDIFGVDASALAAALQTVVAAHPGLHTRIEASEGRVYAVPLPIKAEIPCLKMDLPELERHAAAFAQPFDIFAGPLWRAQVIKTPVGATILWDAHHIIFDGASLDILLRSLDAAYREKQLPPALAEILSLREWAEAEQNREGKSGWNEDRAWYEKLFQNFEAASQIPSDMPPTEKRGEMREAIRPLDGAAMNKFCRENGITPAALCLAASAYAIARWTQSPDAWLSTISSGRSDIRLRNTMGMFVHTIPLHLSLGDNLSRLEYVRSVQKALAEAIEHENYPYARICEEYGFTPHIMYACELGVTGEMRLGEKRAEFESLAVPQPKFALSIHVEERGGQPLFALQYDDALYSPWLAQTLADTIGTALEGIMANPDAPARKLSMLSPDQAKLLDKFNNTGADIPEKLLHRKFEEVVRRLPDHIALIAADERWTYARLNEDSNRIARGLLALGAQTGDRIAFVLPRTGRILIAMLGILKAGCAYIPLDPEYPAERISHVLEDSGVRFVLVDGANDISARLAHLPGLQDMDRVAANMAGDNPDLPLDPDQLAYIIYTSGSTGKPKGVMLRHAGIANYVTAHEFNRHVFALSQEARSMLSVTTVAFDMFLKESMTALCNGLTLVLADDEEARDPVRLANLFARTGADAFNATPSRLLEYAAYPPLLEALANCRVLMAGAEKYPESLLNKLRKGQARLFNTYGPTEITVSCNCKELTEADRITVGPPLLNTREYVVDADNNILPPGVIGELLVGGAGVGIGYNNLPDQTGARFVRLGGERVYRTGDYARWTGDGDIAILGRNDNQVKLRGLRIELGEVEKALAALPGVDVCAVAIRTLNNQEHLCAWYVGGEGSPQTLREKLAAALPRYMVPTAMIRLRKMPSLPNGKTDLRSLPDPEPLAARDYVMPVSALEQTICLIFEAALGMERVGATDSFFDLGGSSLLVARVLVEAGKRQLRNLAYADVFAHPSPRDLAACLEARHEPGQAAPAKQPVMESKDYEVINRLLAKNTLDSFRDGRERPVGNVLLTGATGFLGSHMLHCLLNDGEGQICCLVRRGRHESAEKRLKQILYYYFENAFEELFGKRLLVCEGDITDAGALDKIAEDPDFRPDTIINCAANVSHFSAGTGISDVNLGGVRNLIDLSWRLEARLVQISTASVAGFSINGSPPPDRLLDERSLYIGQNLDNQYVRSKFLAEKAILEAASSGLDAKIMRVGNLMARNRDGEFQINLRSNSFIGRLRAWYAIGGFPYSSFLHRTELAPIDSTAKAVLLLAGAPADCRVFHTFNNHNLFMGDIVEAMRQEGINIPLMEGGEFEKALAQAKNDPEKAERIISLVAYGNMAGGQTPIPLAADSDYTVQALLRHGWYWPDTGNSYLRNFIRGLIGMGFFEM